MAFRGDDASVLDSIDEDWANFQLPDVPGSEGGDDEDSKGIHGKGRGKARRAGGRAGVVKLAKAKAAKPVKCRGCRKKVQGDEIALNFPGCWGCKRALDNLYKLACKQGEEARKFVSEARVCEEACFDLVQNYMAKCPENAVCAGRRRGTWNLLQYIETVKASSGLLKDQVGEFMSKAVYMEFAPTARGGQKSASEAEAQWADWALRVRTATGPGRFSSNLGGCQGPSHLEAAVHARERCLAAGREQEESDGPGRGQVPVGVVEQARLGNQHGILSSRSGFSHQRRSCFH